VVSAILISGEGTAEHSNDDYCAWPKLNAVIDDKGAH
jgi:hypothetical protein